jgi:hypothetical protein
MLSLQHQFYTGINKPLEKHHFMRTFGLAIIHPANGKPGTT